MTEKFLFEDTRPYNDAEVPAAIQRIVSNPSFSFIINYLFPDIDAKEFKEKCLGIKTVSQFQNIVMKPAIWSIVDKTSDGLSSEGFEQLKDNRKRMFVSNHRDILLDAALLQILLLQNELDTSEITFGSNLMQGDLVIDIGKINKMFKIERGGNIRTFYKNSMEVSNYMRYAITHKKQSVWIAQRNGRTKDGDDKTEIGVLKMFSLSSDKPFMENLSELNITPISISYEYEPCAFLKASELFITKYQKYVKSPNEDLNSIINGITQPKGHINMVICKDVSTEDLEECDKLEKNDKFVHLANIMDRRIIQNFKLFPNNYIAYDIQNGTETYSDFYSANQKKDFENYMEDGLSKINLPYEELRSIFLSIYANPVANKRNLNS